MDEERELSSKWKFYNVIILGFGFFLLFTAFQTTANVQVRLRPITKTDCEITVFRLSSITERMSFLLIQTTTISVFFSEKCNSVSCLPLKSSKVTRGNSSHRVFPVT